MAGTSAIEWTEQTWNPVVGCSILTPGCINCYAMPEAARQIRCAAGLGRETHYEGTVETVKGKAVWTGKLALAPDSILLQPLRRKKPTTYFVNSMGDLFHEDCPDEWIDKVFAVMALSPQHTFQVLTKRAKRMRDYFAGNAMARLVKRTSGGHENVSLSTAHAYNSTTKVGGHFTWPLPNVWLGVSTERQQEADERIPELLQTPAAVRFISAEPLLDEIRLGSIWLPESKAWLKALTGRIENCGGSSNLGARINWVIAGGESGPNARPMHPDWARSLREQCAAAGVPFFFKQWGEWAPSTPEAAAGNPRSGWQCIAGHPYVAKVAELYPEAGAAFVEHMGKKRAGRLLDGNLHDAMPACPPELQRRREIVR